MSEKQQKADQRAFENGQNAWRDNKDIGRDNPYPPESPYYDLWRQGWERENDLQQK